MLRNEIAKNRIVMCLDGMPITLQGFTCDTGFGFTMYVAADPVSYETLTGKIIGLGLDVSMLRSRADGSTHDYETLIDVPAAWQPAGI